MRLGLAEEEDKRVRGGMAAISSRLRHLKDQLQQARGTSRGGLPSLLSKGEGRISPLCGLFVMPGHLCVSPCGSSEPPSAPVLPCCP